MRKTGSALAGLATLSLALAGCGKIEPVHHLPPQVAPGGCDEIITFGARLPLPVSPLEGPPQPGAEEAWQTDPRSDPVGLKLLDALGQAPVYEESVVPGAPQVSESVLILSGGSQQGAFGAGFMDAWAQHRGGSLPRGHRDQHRCAAGDLRLPRRYRQDRGGIQHRSRGRAAQTAGARQVRVEAGPHRAQPDAQRHTGAPRSAAR